MARKHMTRAQLIKTNEHLTAHLKVIGEGLVEYEQGWSDELIAKMINVNKSCVASARIELFGKFVRTMPSAANDERLTRHEESLSRLETDIRNTIVKLDALAVKHQKLIENLTLNRVLNVKHLA